MPIPKLKKIVMSLTTGLLDIVNPARSLRTRRMFDVPTDVVHQFGERRRKAGVFIAWARQVDIDFMYNSPRPRRHYVERVSKIDRFRKVVRDKQNRTFSLKPNRLKRVPKFLARERVEGAERFVK